MSYVCAFMHANSTALQTITGPLLPLWDSLGRHSRLKNWVTTETIKRGKKACGNAVSGMNVKADGARPRLLRIRPRIRRYDLAHTAA